MDLAPKNMLGPLKTAPQLDEVRSKVFTHDFRPGYCDIDGFTMPERYLDYKEEIDGLEVHDDDVWVTCFPKTGSTWAREIVWYVANDLDFETPKEPLPYRFPSLEFCTIFDFRNYAKTHENFVPYPGICDSIKLIKNARSPRFIETHLPWRLLPRQIRRSEKRPKIIHIARNPKDTCVSYFHHCKLIEGYTGSFEDFWQLFIANKLMYTPYWDNVLSYWDRRNLTNVLFITYEDMKKDLPTVVRNIAKFLNKELNDEGMKKVMKHLDYESMKNATPIHLEPIVEFLKQFNLCQNESGHFMRAGLIGNYRAQMCADVIDIFDKWSEKHTKNTGLNFDISKYIKRTNNKI